MAPLLEQAPRVKLLTYRLLCWLAIKDDVIHEQEFQFLTGMKVRLNIEGRESFFETGAKFCLDDAQRELMGIGIDDELLELMVSISMADQCCDQQEKASIQTLIKHLNINNPLSQGNRETGENSGTSESQIWRIAEDLSSNIKGFKPESPMEKTMAIYYLLTDTRNTHP